MALPHWESAPEDLSEAIRTIKAALRARIEASGRTVQDVFAVAEQKVADRVTEIQAAKARGERCGRSSTTPTSRWHGDPGRSPSSTRAVACCSWPLRPPPSHDLGCRDRRLRRKNKFFENYRGPGDDFFGSVGSKPEIYPIYWSKPQMEARQSDRMARVQSFLNGQWKSRSEGVQWFDPNRDSLYPDRIRRRPPGADSNGLGPHCDPGTLDLWMTQAYQKAFRHLFDGTIEEYDPWDPAHRTSGPQYRLHHVLGVPHLPGLDRAVRHGPRPRRPADRPDP
jgi:hypothetical protein